MFWLSYHPSNLCRLGNWQLQDEWTVSVISSQDGDEHEDDDEEDEQAIGGRSSRMPCHIGQ